MGEYIVQLAGERPSHIIMPAIHKTKQQIAELFAAEHPGRRYTDDVDELIAIGRARAARRSSATPTIGVSGVNFVVAETGTLVPGRERRQRPHVHHRARGAHRHHRHREGGRAASSTYRRCSAC